MNSEDVDISTRFRELSASWRISWSSSSQLVLCLFSVSLLIPIIVIMCTLPSSEVPQSFAIMASLTITLAVSIPFLIFLFVPHQVEYGPDGFLRVFSLCKLSLFSCKAADITSVRTLCFREYICTRSRGWPTDWSRAILISLKNASCIALSVEDPDQFIIDIKSI
jgi:hypothetical protein